MPQEVKSDATEPTGPTGERPTLQGLIATREDERALYDALEEAFDYRGDVTIDLTDGSCVRGYVFDRRSTGTLEGSSLRIMREDSDEKITVPYDRIARLEFTGRDTAAGKSFETWLKKYIEKKLAGEKASIESEPLD
jgi:hypothetical protein